METLVVYIIYIADFDHGNPSSSVYTCTPLLINFLQIRIIFRLVEFSHGTGTNNPIPTHEVYMYCLDALPMALALYTMAISHPARTLVGPDSEFPKLTRAEKKQQKEAKKAEKLEMKAAKRNANPNAASFLDVNKADAGQHGSHGQGSPMWTNAA